MQPEVGEVHDLMHDSRVFPALDAQERAVAPWLGLVWHEAPELNGR